MLKILHAADLHLDSPFAGLSPEQAAQRRAEQRELVRSLADLAAQEQVDLVLLCMRFALVDALFKDQETFVILDDPFVNLDDLHTAQALELLQTLSSNRQILYLTCHSSRMV